MNNSSQEFVTKFFEKYFATKYFKKIFVRNIFEFYNFIKNNYPRKKYLVIKIRKRNNKKKYFLKFYNNFYKKNLTKY